jgi:hypothetical protein
MEEFLDDLSTCFEIIGIGRRPSPVETSMTQGADFCTCMNFYSETVKY